MIFLLSILFHLLLTNSSLYCFENRCVFSESKEMTITRTLLSEKCTNIIKPTKYIKKSKKYLIPFIQILKPNLNFYIDYSILNQIIKFQFSHLRRIYDSLRAPPAF